MLLFKKRPKQFHGHIDRFSVVRLSLYVEGWASHFEPAIYYDGKPLQLVVTKVERPDLESHFSASARSWGFALCAMLPTVDIDRTKFRFRLNAGMTIDNPGERFTQQIDNAYIAMVDRFRKAVRGPDSRLLEIGSRARSGTVYRDWFPELQHYTGIDIATGPNVDIVCDAHHLSAHVNGPFDFVFSIATFEHLLMPWKVAIEMNTVMRDGGLALIISHPAWPLHEEPWDFFRFSKESWSGLFNAHTGFKMLEAAYQHEALIIPTYINNPHFERMSQGQTYLLSGCLVQKIGPSAVRWDANISILDLANYGW